MKKRMLCLLAGVVLILSACGQGKQDSENADTSSTTAGRMQTEPGTEQETQNSPDDAHSASLEEMSASVKDEKRNYVYSGEDVVIEYQYMAKGMPSVGIMLLCDGVAVPFHTGENENDAILQSIPLENGEEKDINLCFIPYGKQGEKVSVEIVDIVDPDYDVTVGEKEDIIADYVQELKYRVNYISGIYVTMKADGAAHEEKIFNGYSTEIITKGGESASDGEMSVNADGYVNNEQSLWYTVKQGQKMDVDIQYSGETSGNFLTSLYIDGKPYPTFDGNIYAECSVDKKHLTKISGTIDTADLEKGRHTVFSVCGNIDYNNAEPTLPFVIEVE